MKFIVTKDDLVYWKHQYGMMQPIKPCCDTLDETETEGYMSEFDKEINIDCKLKFNVDDDFIVELIKEQLEIGAFTWGELLNKMFPVGSIIPIDNDVSLDDFKDLQKDTKKECNAKWKKIKKRKCHKVFYKRVK